MTAFRSLTRAITLLPFRIQRAEFYRDLAEMYRRSEPMLGFLEGEITNAVHTGSHAKALALRLILRRLQEGENASRLGYLLEGVMPTSDAMMLLAVDRAADKPAALEALALAVDHQNAMKKVVLAYAAMPLAMLPLCFALISVLSDIVLAIQKSTPVYVAPELWRGFNGVAKLIAEFVVRHGLLAGSVLIAALVALFWCLPRWRGLVRLRLEGWPVFSLYRDFQAGLLFTSLAMLLKTGGTLKASIEDIAQASSLWMRWHLRRVLSALDDNPNATLEAFSRGILSPHLLSRAATLKRSASNFSEVLIDLGTKEGPRVVARVRVAALVANVALVGALGSVAATMGLASITVPGRFATLMDPTVSMSLKAAHEATTSAPPQLPP